MKLNINLEEDEQIRKEVRNLVEGQVSSILRENIKDLIIEVMSKNEGKFTADRLEVMAKDEIKIHVKGFVNDVTPGYIARDNRNRLDDLIRQEVRKMLETKTPFIEDVIKKHVVDIQIETLDIMINKSVEKKVKSFLSNLLNK